METALSVEDQLSSIEEQYLDAYKKLGYLSDRSGRGYTIGLDETVETIKSATSFKRKIELLFEDIKKISNEKTGNYFNRCMETILVINVFMRGDKGLKGVFRSLDGAEFIQAFNYFRQVRGYMYQFIEDVRLIYALRIYPIEEKLALKSKLGDYGFTEVIKCLDEAETNLAQKHFKDCIDRSREALEKTVADILTSLDERASGYFSTDMGNLGKLGIIKKEPKRLIEATYSYLSEVGAHGRGGKLKLGDAHYSMKETYMRIDILLKKYEEYRKKVETS